MAGMKRNRQRETQKQAKTKRECDEEEKQRQEHTEPDHVPVSGGVIKAVSNTQECRNVRLRRSHQETSEEKYFSRRKMLWGRAEKSNVVATKGDRERDRTTVKRVNKAEIVDVV